MDIYFVSRKLQKTCNNQKQLIKKHGARRARKISQHLHNLRAAQTLVDMRHLPGRCHELKGDRAGHFALDLDHPYRLIFKPFYDVPACKNDGGIDWQLITAVIIIAVEDYH